MKLAFLLLLVLIPVLPAQSPTADERVGWFAQNTYGTNTLLIAGPFSSGWRTLLNRPEEWGRTWSGFGKRYGVRVLNNTIQNGTDVTLGAIWNEDPRYLPLGKGSPGQRFRHSLKYTFGANYGGGRTGFAVARAAGITTASFAQNAWMPDSVNSNRDAAFRIGTSYAARLASNLFQEFGKDLFRKFKK